MTLNLTRESGLAYRGVHNLVHQRPAEHIRVHATLARRLVDLTVSSARSLKEDGTASWWLLVHPRPTDGLLEKGTRQVPGGDVTSLPQRGEALAVVVAGQQEREPLRQPGRALATWHFDLIEKAEQGGRERNCLSLDGVGICGGSFRVVAHRGVSPVSVRVVTETLSFRPACALVPAPTAAAAPPPGPAPRPAH